MSRAAGFSIRKLISQRRTSWPDSDDDNEEAFECSSAKTIRMQYELEQYQLQQLHKEGRHQLKHRASWMNGNTSPKKKGPKKVPKPITVVRNSGDGVTVQSGASASSRRVSTPVLSSRSFTNRHSPATPHLRTSNESQCPFCGGDRYQQHQCQQQQRTKVARKAASCGSPPQSPQTSSSVPSFLLSPTFTPSHILSKKSSQEKSLHAHGLPMCLPSPGLQNDGHRTPSPTQVQSTPISTSFHKRSAHVRSPSLKAPTDVPMYTSRRSPIAMNALTPQHSAFVNGQPSPPLEAEDESRGILKSMPSQSRLSVGEECTWFLGEGDEDQYFVPDSVQQLIWETDAAFKAVSSALADAKLASELQPSSREAQAHLRQWQEASRVLRKQESSAALPPLETLPATTYQSSIPRVQSQLTSPLSPTAGAGRGTIAGPRKGSKSPSLTAFPHLRRSPTLGPSISKSKRGSKSPKAKTTRSASLDAAAAQPLAPGSPPKGHLHSRSQPHSHSYQRSLVKLNLAADKVTDKIFEGRGGGRFGFIKIEADEVVTPSQVHLYTQLRLAKAQEEAQAEAKRATSIESLRSRAASIGDGNSSDAGVAEDKAEPSHVNALSPVAEASSPGFLSTPANKDVMGQGPIINEPKTPTETKEFKIGQNYLLATPPATPPQVPATFPSQTTNADEDDSMHLRNIGFQKAPSRRHTRAHSSTSHIAPLPTIPEVRITAPQARGLSQGSQQLQGRNSLEQGRGTDEANGDGAPYFEEDDEHMFFQSTPLTTTMPTFQHGRIRLAKADLVNAGTINSLESKLLTSPDETLDWTAFQMAILGGAGELFSDPDSFLARDAQEDMVDDLCNWFEDLGFTNQDLGTLITTKPPRTITTTATPATPGFRPAAAVTGMPGSARNKAFHDPSRAAALPRRAASVASSGSGSASSSSLSVSDEGLLEAQEMLQVQSMPIPITSEHPSGFWNARRLRPEWESDASRFLTGAGCGLKRWTLEGHPKRYTGPGIDVGKANTLPRSDSGLADLGGPPLPQQRREQRCKDQDTSPLPSGRKSGRYGGGVRASIDSLPQSPMLDLRETTAVDGSKEFVPMGYNLGHDLGDFLKWESEHVMASGFYGTD